MPNIDEFKDSNALKISFVSTAINIVLTWYFLWAESNCLREYVLDYILLEMKAKLDWFPYGMKLKYCNI